MIGITRCILSDIHRVRPMMFHRKWLVRQRSERTLLDIYFTYVHRDVTILRRKIGLAGKSGSTGRFIMAGGLLAICSYLQYQFFVERREKV